MTALSAPALTESSTLMGSHHDVEVSDEDELSIEQLFTLFMEASTEAGKAREMLQATSPSEPCYSDLQNIFEMMLRKRDNYQLKIVNHARQSEGSLQFLKSVGVNPPRDEVAEVQHLQTQQSQDSECTAHNRESSSSPIQIDKSEDDDDDVPLASRHRAISPPEKEKGPEALASEEKNDAHPETAVEHLSDVAVSSTTTSASTQPRTFSAAPLIPTRLNRSPSPVLASDSALVAAVTSEVPKTSPPQNANGTASPQHVVAPSNTSTLSASHHQPLTQDELDVILRAIAAQKIDVEQAKKFITRILNTLKDNSTSLVQKGVTSLLLVVEKENYGSAFDLRYFVVDGFIAVFAENVDLRDALAADKPLMIRIGNWLRFEQRQQKLKSEHQSEGCLRFIEFLKCTKRQLSDFKILEVLDRIATKNEEPISRIATDIIKAAEEKQALVQPPSKGFSVASFISQSTRKVSTENAVVPLIVKIEPPNVVGEVKSILKKKKIDGGNSPKKAVTFKADHLLEQIQYIEASGSHSEEDHSAEDSKRAKAMELSEGQRLREAAKEADPTPDLPFGIKEFDRDTPWRTPALIEICGDDFLRSSITRGGSLPIVHTDDTANFKRPTAPPYTHLESPLESDGLITRELKFDYMIDERGVLINQKPTTPTQPPVFFPRQSQKSPENHPSAPSQLPPSSHIPEVEQPSTRKRFREEDAWGLSPAESKRARAGASPPQLNISSSQNGGLSRGLGGDDQSHSHVPEPQRRGVVELRDHENDHPSILTDKIIQWRRQDVRTKVSTNSRTLPVNVHSELCSHFPRCRFGQGCKHIHLRSRQKVSAEPARKISRSRR